jgi:uncharacterized protein
VVGGARGRPPRDPVAVVTPTSPVHPAPPRRASALYVGTVRHRRRRPTARAFRYRTYHVLLDLDELEALDHEIRGFGYGRRALTTFWDTDHFGAHDLPVRAKLARWLNSQGVELPAGPVRVLTNLRVLGHVFNPVSWWYCYATDGRLELIVAEVHNTFGEAHGYILEDLRPGAGDTLEAEADKVFHVSPFLPIEGLRYRFTVVPPGQRVLAHIDVDDAQGVVFDATQVGRRVPLTTGSLAKVLLTHPLITLHTVLRIHLQALSLWWRRVPFHRKPRPPASGGFERFTEHPDGTTTQPSSDHRSAAPTASMTRS